MLKSPNPALRCSLITEIKSYVNKKCQCKQRFCDKLAANHLFLYKTEETSL